MTREKRYTIIKEALDISDPMRLLALGCPLDEYSDEARLIEEKFNVITNQNIFTLKDIISDIFYEQFNENVSNEICEKIATDIIEKLW